MKKIVQIAVTQDYKSSDGMLFALTDTGEIWQRSPHSWGEWKQLSELPPE